MRYYQYSIIYILFQWFVIHPDLSECFLPTTTTSTTSTTLISSSSNKALRKIKITPQTNNNNPSSTSLQQHPNDAYSSEDTLSSSTTSTEKIPLDILYENKLYQIYTLKGETILSALERARASPDPNTRIPLPPIPQDCRRGNCLTCSGRLLCQTSSSSSSSSSTNHHHHPTNNVLKHISSSSFTSPAAFAASAATSTAVSSSYDKIKRGEDGLNPGMSRDMERAGFVLLCSSYVVEEGVRIEIGVKEEAWDLAYRYKMEGEEAQLMGVEASAKTIRQAAEKNVPKWINQTEETLKRTSSM